MGLLSRNISSGAVLIAVCLGTACNNDVQVLGGTGGILASGGDVQVTGGDVQATGGDVQATGGDVQVTGGDVQVTGGDVQVTGGDVQVTGGDVAVEEPPDFAEEGPHAVILDQNVGAGFEATIASSDTGDGIAGCQGFVSLFGQDAEESREFITIPADLDMALYTLYRPEVLEEGKKYPVVTWGNGTCSLPEGYGYLLRHVASHGFIVIAGHSRQVGSTGVMTKALDWVFEANQDPQSDYYQKFDVENIGGFGHSQGGSATVTAARDSRVKSVVLFNGGTSATKHFLSVSGDRDLAGSQRNFERAVDSASVDAAWLWYNDVPGTGNLDGHLTLITEPARVFGPTVAWFKYTLEGSVEGRDYIANDVCLNCGAHESGHNGL